MYTSVRCFFSASVRYGPPACSTRRRRSSAIQAISLIHSSAAKAQEAQSNRIYSSLGSLRLRGLLLLQHEKPMVRILSGSELIRNLPATFDDCLTDRA